MLFVGSVDRSCVLLVVLCGRCFVVCACVGDSLGCILGAFSREYFVVHICFLHRVCWCFFYVFVAVFVSVLHVVFLLCLLCALRGCLSGIVALVFPFIDVTF